MALDPVKVIFIVVNIFEDLQIPYFIGGSLASALDSVVRTIADCGFEFNFQKTLEGQQNHSGNPIIRHN